MNHVFREIAPLLPCSASSVKAAHTSALPARKAEPKRVSPLNSSGTDAFAMLRAGSAQHFAGTKRRSESAATAKPATHEKKRCELTPEQRALMMPSQRFGPAAAAARESGLVATIQGCAAQGPALVVPHAEATVPQAQRRSCGWTGPGVLTFVHYRSASKLLACSEERPGCML